MLTTSCTGTFAQCKRKLKVGTVAYQAPEIVNKLPHDAAVDWWALGCVLLELLCGAQIFAAGCEDDEAIEQRILAHVGGLPDLAGLPGDAPPPVLSAAATDAIGKLLDPSAAQRLGGGAAGGAEAVQRQTWFEPVDWEVSCSVLDYHAALGTSRRG